MMSYCFSEINTKSTIRQELLQLCNNEKHWIDPNIGTFLQKTPPKDLIYKDNFLKVICENFISNYDTDVHIFMINPWTHYMLHTDSHRSSSINLLINDFTDSISYFKVSEIYKSQIDIQELQYKPDTYYLINSKVPHAITNRDLSRYVLSITLNDNFRNIQSKLKDQLCL